MVSDREMAIFEAGIKLGALYHQWVGTPISPSTSGQVERTIESSVGLQPYVREIRVRLDTGLMSPNEFGYSELTGLMLTVDLCTRVGDVICHARLSRKGDYPMMEVISCYEDPAISRN